MANSAGDRKHSVIPFAPDAKGAVSDDADELDQAGQTILKLLHKAADVAEQNSRHALDMAQKLSHQLRAAEDRVAELEAEVQLYREKADRAEQWLHKVYTEIEDRFIRQSEERRLAAVGSTGRCT
jgi:molecular chaperone GrpE (heat shock protein)